MEEMIKTQPIESLSQDKKPYIIPTLSPLSQHIYQQADTKAVLKKLISAKAILTKLSGTARIIPNQEILLHTLSLQEAKASSAIENIFTTQDALFKGQLDQGNNFSPETKEVEHYNQALYSGFKAMQEKGNLLTNNILIEIFQTLEQRTGGFRENHPVVLRNERTGEDVHIPPAKSCDVQWHMKDLEAFINDNACDLDPLIKMAIIHHQFETIHPFPDGNGRTGRILNVLYLTKEGLLDLPILYLSRSINRTKDEYYRKLQRERVRDFNAWEEWILYILNVIEETAQITLDIINNLAKQMREMKERMRTEFPRIYSQDLLNILFRFPYTKAKHLEERLNISRQTATKYLNKLTEKGFLKKYPVWRENYFINHKLVDLFLNVSGE